ncbi:MAG: aminoacyl-tRNA hydrolase [Mogibacterium sp.]|nr:aminoacyl-tRNA hydrolase [Mogibacterium sp.]
MGLFRKEKKAPGFAEDTYVIAGLGNPGKEYEDTRHNMGYKAIDVLSSNENIEVRKSKFHSVIGQGRIAGKKAILVKPETYMNRSGIAVRESAMYFNVPPQNLIVIYDDIDLPAGSIRIRKSGGAGTHNGMKSVVEQLGTKDFVRIRIGVGAAEAGEDLVDRVIGKVPKAEQELLQKAAAEAADAVADILASGVDIAMNKHNHVSVKEQNDN